MSPSLSTPKVLGLAVAEKKYLWMIMQASGSQKQCVFSTGRYPCPRPGWQAKKWHIKTWKGSTWAQGHFFFKVENKGKGLIRLELWLAVSLHRFSSYKWYLSFERFKMTLFIVGCWWHNRWFQLWGVHSNIIWNKFRRKKKVKMAVGFNLKSWFSDLWLARE